jgi:large subunit ribosomal protein L22
MTIAHVAAHKVGERQGRRPRAFGRASEWNTPEVDVELILEEVEEDAEVEA